MKKSRLINQLISRPNTPTDTPINTPTQNQSTNCELEQIDKQAVEEMAKDIGDTWVTDLDGDVKGLNEILWKADIDNIATELYQMGYRRQSEGEWIAKEVMTRTPDANNYTCSACGCENAKTTPFCPNCGAKMKGNETKVSSHEICVACGEHVPEGRQICSMCRTGQEFLNKKKE